MLKFFHICSFFWTLIFFFARILMASDFPLKDIAVEHRIDISGIWKFTEDSGDIGTKEEWFSQTYNRQKWESVQVPGVWRQKPKEVKLPVYSGIGWYARTVNIPAGWNGDVAIVFLGSMYVTDVWINGKYVGVHRGGYSPFYFMITKFVSSGASAMVVVRVDNRLGETIPSSHIGWQAFGGLYREVFLVHMPKVRPEHIATYFSVPPAGNPQLSLTADMVNTSGAPYSGTIAATLLDGNRVVGYQNLSFRVGPDARTPIRFSMMLKNPRLWSPENPVLHTLRIEWNFRGKKQVVFQVGVREFSVRNGAIVLNNRRIWLQGIGNHEEYPGYGPCISRKKRVKELEMIRYIFNCNTLRPGHYPNHPDIYDICDRLGIIVHSEIPSWQVNRNFVQSDQAWQMWLRPQLEEMVQTLRNHACVAFWGLSNEQYNCPLYNEKAASLVRGMDNSRFVTIVCAATSDLDTIRLTDVTARNFHYGWYHSQSVYALRDGLASVERATQDKPIWVAELGAHANFGKYTGGYGDQSRGSETYQDKVVRFGFQYCSTASEKISGVTLWTLADFHRNGALEPHGIMNEMREPKLVAYTMCNLLRGDLRLFICEDDTMCKQGGRWKASLRFFNPYEQSRRGIVIRWRILKAAEEVASGKISTDIPARRSGEIGNIAWDIPKDAGSGLYVCWVEMMDASGNWIYTNSSPFDVGEPSRPGILKVIPNTKGKFPEKVFASFAGVRIPVYPEIGLCLPLSEGTYRFTFSAAGFEQKKDITITSGRAETIVVDFTK